MGDDRFRIFRNELQPCSPLQYDLHRGNGSKVLNRESTLTFPQMIFRRTLCTRLANDLYVGERGSTSPVRSWCPS